MTPSSEVSFGIPRDPSRWAVTAGALALFWWGSRITLPGLDPEALARMPSVSAERLSIFALGVTPILTAAVLVEMARLTIPPLARWTAASSANADVLARVFRVVALILAMIQAIGLAPAFERIDGLVAEPGGEFQLTVVLVLVGATAFLIWLAGVITNLGVGDGLLLLLAAPVVARLPSAAQILFESVEAGAVSEGLLALGLGLTLAAVVALVAVSRTREAAGKLDVWAPLLGTTVFQVPLALTIGMQMAVGFGSARHGPGLGGLWGGVAAGALLIALLAVQAGLIALLAYWRNVAPGAANKTHTPGIVVATQILVCGGGLASALLLHLPGAAVNGLWLIFCVAAGLSLLRDGAHA